MDGRSDPGRLREAATSLVEMGVLKDVRLEWAYPASLHQLLVCLQHVQVGPTIRWKCGLPSSPASPLPRTRLGALHPHGCQPAPRWPQVQARCGIQVTQRQSGHRVSCGHEADDGLFVQCNSQSSELVFRLLLQNLPQAYSYFYVVKCSSLTFVLNALSLGWKPTTKMNLVYSLLASGIKCLTPKSILNTNRELVLFSKAKG